MKYYFKSDYFRYAHPVNMPRPVGDFTEEDLKVAIENTDRFKYNKELFETAVYESDDRIPESQIGTIILFPEIEPHDMMVMNDFIKKVFSKVEAELGEEYDDETDPTMFWEMGCNGQHFSGTTRNYKTKETFGINSPSIYIAGCKDSTADYLIEIAIDKMYLESSKHDKKSKNANCKIGFDRFKTFLVFSVGSKRFYEFGTHENQLYHRQRKSVATCGNQGIPVYELPVIPSNNL